MDQMHVMDRHLPRPQLDVDDLLGRAGPLDFLPVAQQVLLGVGLHMGLLAKLVSARAKLHGAIGRRAVGQRDPGGDDLLEPLHRHVGRVLVPGNVGRAAGRLGKQLGVPDHDVGAEDALDRIGDPGMGHEIEGPAVAQMWEHQPILGIGRRPLGDPPAVFDLISLEGAAVFPCLLFRQHVDWEEAASLLKRPDLIAVQAAGHGPSERRVDGYQ